MRCLNSPATLNALELQIVEGVPAGAKHVLVVNAGDGRLARAIREKVRGEAAVSVVTLQPGLVPCVDDFSGAGGNAWDFAWHEGRVAAHGAYDGMVLYQLHEFWRGELHGLHRLIALAAPGATVWASFLNAQASRMSARFLPAVRLGFTTLAEPTRVAAAVDYASFTDFVVRCGGHITHLWGMLDQEALQYCQKRAGGATIWEMRGLKVKIGTVADAFLWGASVTAVAFRCEGGEDPPPVPRIAFVPYSAVLLQALLLPYPGEQAREATLCSAEFELEAWRRAPLEKAGHLMKLLLEQAGGLEQRRRALIVGVGWGRDLLVMRRAAANWEWVGIEADRDLLALGGDLLAAENATALAVGADAALPFADNSFDLAFSLGHFSTLYEPAARHLAGEMRRVTSGTIHHLEDSRGPDCEIQLKLYSLKAVYSGLGCESAVQQVLIDGNPNGMYFVNVMGRN